jgi:hypothetical protein
VSSLRTDFSHRLQNPGHEIVLHKSDIASGIALANDRSEKIQSEIQQRQCLIRITRTFMVPQVVRQFLKWRIKVGQGIEPESPAISHGLNYLRNETTSAAASRGAPEQRFTEISHVSLKT